MEKIWGYRELFAEDAQQIDILAYYQRRERYVNQLIKQAIKININGYNSSFFYENPWTKILENKKVFVISPFVKSIKKQYENNRENLFTDPNVFPKFAAFYTIEAVQSIAGHETPFANWFEALYYMKAEMEKYDFNIALIGCGAYAIHLAARVKKMGKIGLHMAANTQVLFCVYGRRWIDDKRFNNIINQYWIRPNESETITKHKEIENGAYW
ncbi:TPA: hypothetical protein IVM20_002535 [Enterococcus faecium]|uniref:hypothetical protein n=1 Tax=Bacteria TaxID=2 RepID=UPI000C9F0529|nr:hypothetical protein [Enterococcus faecium]MBY3657724.1 hypothetical protein [Enterococcus faecium]MBY3660612.1 hypothetical protein [Enterococcus faecium]MCE3179005.1 hypothetical protein [Enterococcus faecium]MCL4623820.1 hypothetical protein [Enterococcus faecium]MDN6959290.1 hypothetical protein [Enterococcus faecium]